MVDRGLYCGYPSITAARAVQVNPMAIPIHGVCPSVPSLRFVSSAVVLRVRRERLLLLRRGIGIVSGLVCVSATGRRSSWSASEGICASSSAIVCTSGTGTVGDVFGTDGLCVKLWTRSACTIAIVGARQRRIVEGFIAWCCMR
jgi:hypothetical protein